MTDQSSGPKQFPKQYVVHTLGCKANFADSLEIETKLQTLGWRPGSKGRHASNPDEVGLCVINSCSVTDEADRQAKRMARKLAKQYPGSRVVMTGCGAEVDPVAMSQVEGVTDVVGNQNKDEFTRVLGLSSDIHNLSTVLPNETKIRGSVTSYSEILSQHPMDREWPPATLGFGAQASSPIASQNKRTRVFIKIQEGCNSFCTYCIIPYGRGPSRSVSSHEIIEQVRLLALEGVQEIVLTGTNIGEYAEPLSDLVEALLAQTPISRIRLSSLDPVQITPALLKLAASTPRLCPHFHVSLQSPHSKILKMMKRDYRFEEVEACLKAISALPAPLGGVFIGMDVITGFPGETELDFDWTFKALESLPWSRLHVFPYSERKGTPATRIPGSVPLRERKERARRLSELSMHRLRTHYEQVLAPDPNPLTGPALKQVLIERGMKNGFAEGYTPNYLRVLIRPESLSPRESALHAEGKLLLDVVPESIIQDSAQGDVALIGKSAH